MINTNKKIRAAFLGATGMVGREGLRILSNHPKIDIVALAAGPNSAGKRLKDSIKDRVQEPNFNGISDSILNLVVKNATDDIDEITSEVDFVFSALDLPDGKIIELEKNYALKEVVVVSNNSAYRPYNYVPTIVPEVNGESHIEVLPNQRKILGTDYGCIVVKPNCAAQSYMGILDAIKHFDPYDICVSLSQAISGSGKYLNDVEEIQGNQMALPGEARKSENEPKKIFGSVKNGLIIPNETLNIQAISYRAPVQDGHLANIFFKTRKNTDPESIIKAFNDYNPLEKYNLYSAPNPPINYLGDNVFPSIKKHVNNQGGMEFTCGGLSYNKESGIYQISGLTHNLVRGAAGGAILTAELLIAKDIIQSKSK